MKKVKVMKDAKPQQTTQEAAAAQTPVKRPAHITLVKPAPAMGKDPGGGCRPTGVQ